MSTSLLNVQDLRHAYGPLEILHGLSFEVRAQESVAIIGPSGSGKTTLLSLLAGLDPLQDGDVQIRGRSLKALGAKAVNELRARTVGMVFQRFHLVPSLTAVENVALPLELRGDNRAFEVAKHRLGQVGLSDREDASPKTLSGGEAQRVAIARALAISPELILADEPTGNLDHDNADRVADLLFSLTTDEGVGLVLVTHSRELASRCQRVLRLERGRLTEEAA